MEAYESNIKRHVQDHLGIINTRVERIEIYQNVIIAAQY